LDECGVGWRRGKAEKCTQPPERRAAINEAEDGGGGGGGGHSDRNTRNSHRPSLHHVFVFLSSGACRDDVNANFNVNGV
jgi:hypothetical protein